MKKISLTLALIIGCITMVNAISPGKDLDTLYQNKKLTSGCYTCIKGSLSAAEAEVKACLLSKISPDQDITQITEVFLGCVKAELSTVEKLCSSSCKFQTSQKSSK